MGAIRLKDVFPAMRTSHHIPAIRLHEDIDLSGPLGVIEGYACRSSLGLSSPGVLNPATTPLAAGRGRWVWLFTHPVCPYPIMVPAVFFLLCVVPRVLISIRPGAPWPPANPLCQSPQ
jgi:hypothetical protein